MIKQVGFTFNRAMPHFTAGRPYLSELSIPIYTLTALPWGMGLP